MRREETKVRPKRWQMLLAAAVGLVAALAPVPAVPLSGGDSLSPAAVDRDGSSAEALVVRTVLRLADDPDHRSSRLTTS